MSVRKRNDGSAKRRYSELENGETAVEEKRADIQGDKKNIGVLLFLYILQGIPLGLLHAIPLILLKSGVNYKQQAQFSFVNWPFSLKLLWAPIVDSIYWSQIGRRRSWLVPIQYLIGIVMLYMSWNINNWLGTGTDKNEPSMYILTFSFFCLNFLAATQDIAVDGWALTMLKRENVGYASTCNSVGQTAGYFLGYVVFIALESAEFCNSYLRTEASDFGIITLPAFLQFWGWIFMITTTAVLFFKSEKPNDDGDSDFNLKESYCLLWDITKLPSIRTIICILLTVKVAFSAVDSVSGLKLIEAGLAKEKLALLAIPLTPMQILLPLVIAKYTAGPKPMDIFLTAVPYRLLTGVVIAFIVYLTPLFIHDNGYVPYYYYVLLLFVYCLYQITLYSMFVAQMAFFARISDPSVGGTYMTFLNTMANLGGNWPQTLALWMVDGLTYKQCTNNEDNLCDNVKQIENCKTGNGSCDTQVDGYYLEVAVCTVFGLVWLMWGRSRVKHVQDCDIKSYRVVTHVKRGRR